MLVFKVYLVNFRSGPQWKFGGGCGVQDNVDWYSSHLFPLLSTSLLSQESTPQNRTRKTGNKGKYYCYQCWPAPLIGPFKVPLKPRALHEV